MSRVRISSPAPKIKTPRAEAWGYNVFVTDLMKLLHIEANDITAAFKTASIEGKGTPQEISDRREAVVKKFLEKYFPFPFRIAKGGVIDSLGKKSQSIDCLVLNPCHPYTVSNDDKYSLIFVDGVDFAIEVKPDLGRSDEIHRALRQIVSVKQLTRVKNGIDLSFPKFSVEAIKRLPTFIFANKTYKNIRDLIKTIVDFYVKEQTPKHEQFDFIVINNLGIVFNSKKDGYFSDLPDEGIFYRQYDENTIAMFLFWLNKLPRSGTLIDAPVLWHYIKIEDHDLTFYNDLNARLLSIE